MKKQKGRTARTSDRFVGPSVYSLDANISRESKRKVNISFCYEDYVLIFINAFYLRRKYFNCLILKGWRSGSTVAYHTAATTTTRFPYEGLHYLGRSEDGALCDNINLLNHICLRPTHEKKGDSGAFFSFHY